MRRLVPILALTAVLVACARTSAPGQVPAASTSTEAPASTRLDYYEPLIREMAGLEGWHDSPLYIRTEICAGAEDPGVDRRCEETFSEAEQQELATRLADLAPTITFVPDWEHAGLEIENRDGATMVWVGVPQEHGDGLWIGAGMWCGGLCGHGGTYVVEPRGERWVVEGNAPGTGAWIS